MYRELEAGGGEVGLARDVEAQLIATHTAAVVPVVEEALSTVNLLISATHQRAPKMIAAAELMLSYRAPRSRRG